MFNPKSGALRQLAPRTRHRSEITPVKLVLASLQAQVIHAKQVQFVHKPCQATCSRTLLSTGRHRRSDHNDMKAFERTDHFDGRLLTAWMQVRPVQLVLRLWPMKFPAQINQEVVCRSAAVHLKDSGSQDIEPCYLVFLERLVGVGASNSSEIGHRARLGSMTDSN